MILLVDDDRNMLDLVTETLAEAGYEVETALDGYHALKLFHQDPSRYDLAVIDVGLPGIRGVSVADEMLKYRPKQKILFITGYIVHEDIAVIRERGMKVVHKPFDLGEFVEVVGKILKPV